MKKIDTDSEKDLLKEKEYQKIILDLQNKVRLLEEEIEMMKLYQEERELISTGFRKATSLPANEDDCDKSPLCHKCQEY